MKTDQPKPTTGVKDWTVRMGDEGKPTTGEWTVEQLKSYWFVNPNGVGFLEERRLLCDITTALDAAKKEAYEQGRQDERNAERGLV